MLLVNIFLEPGKLRVLSLSFTMECGGIRSSQLSLPLPSLRGTLCYHSSEKPIARAPETSYLV
uniref:Uncharacterized protein n=1 Tax=Picea glauca TaxID=3330 RepID=A0A117NGE2_PICGL|nr:hypothetical protein ABT39_MTgene1337 [Picea glauca]QHR89506.1 hypothetical protein Q903MT_gene3528 [Picea sitchensis]